MTEEKKCWMKIGVAEESESTDEAMLVVMVDRQQWW
jgi:hypothetical protein